MKKKIRTASCPDLYQWGNKVKPLGKLARMTAWKLITSKSSVHQSLFTKEKSLISHSYLLYTYHLYPLDKTYNYSHLKSYLECLIISQSALISIYLEMNH